MIDAEEEKSSNPKIKEYQDAIRDLEAKDKMTKKDKDQVEMLKVVLKKEKENAGESDKLKKLKKLKDEILAKESWQLEGTELGRLLEMEITKLENEMILNESRYHNTSIKDAFSRLI